MRSLKSAAFTIDTNAARRDRAAHSLRRSHAAIAGTFCANESTPAVGPWAPRPAGTFPAAPAITTFRGDVRDAVRICQPAQPIGRGRGLQLAAGCADRPAE